MGNNSSNANGKDGNVVKERLAKLPPQFSTLLNYTAGKKAPKQPQSQWEFTGTSTLGYYSRELHKQTDEWNSVVEIIGKLGGKENKTLDISKIVSIHNPTLLRTFTTQLGFFETRISEDPQLFLKQTWQKKGSEQEKDLRKFIYDTYSSHANAFDWNKGREVPIVPAIQRVESESEARDVAHTGFQVADPSSSPDAFKYGHGLYFTTDCLFVPEDSKHASSQILVFCLTIPGNVYPVIEQPDSEISLTGSPVVAGYNSHYVLTSKDSRAITKKEEVHSDQLVVAQEAQVFPVFIVHVNRP